MPEGKVVIIECDPTIVKMLREPFQEAGFEVESAEGGKEGLELCRRIIPQAILMNADLPDTDGYEVCRELRETTRTRHAHLVMLARSNRRDDRIAALELGANDYITIPFDPDEVTLRVRNALRRATAENLTDPTTGLPSGRLIRSRLRDLLREQNWALLGINVRRLEEFEAVHGFMALQDVLQSIVRGLGETIERWGNPKDFVGHSGGGRFLIISTPDRAAPLMEGLNARVEEELMDHHSLEEREQGYMVLQEGEEARRVPLMEIEVHSVLPSDGPFYDIRSLTEALG